MVNDTIEVKLQSSLGDLGRIIDHLYSESRHYKTILLQGEVGSGKTTLIRGLMERAGSQDQVSSPTFSLVNEYLDGEGVTIYHMDLYRLESVEEALSIGITEYLGSGELVLIEWPELILELLDPPYLSVEIREGPDDDREYLIKRHD